MRRSRTLLGLGWFLALLLAITVTARSRADSRVGPQGAPPQRATSLYPAVGDLQLLPSLATRSTPLLGAFIRPQSVPEALPGDSACTGDMVEVEGDYCPLVQQKCLRWLDPSTRLMCEDFDKASQPSACLTKTQHKHFCMDRYEWPDKVGAMPSSMESWYDAKAACEGVGKRLCTDTEWTLACEGPERHPYPYGDGYERDDRACNIDKPYIWPHPERLFNPRTSQDELSRLDQREPSGSRSACVSPYGVHDMVGNVDEWVVNVSQSGKPFRSGLKGGYWGPVRTRCRPMTTAHDETFRYYQIGFRCCDGVRPVALAGAPLAGR